MKSILVIMILVVTILSPVISVQAQDETYYINEEINAGVLAYKNLGQLDEQTLISGRIHCIEPPTYNIAGYKMYVVDSTVWQLILEGNSGQIPTTAFSIWFGWYVGHNNVWEFFEYEIPETETWYLFFEQVTSPHEEPLDDITTVNGHVNITFPVITTTATSSTSTTTSSTTNTEEPTFNPILAIVLIVFLIFIISIARKYPY